MKAIACLMIAGLGTSLLCGTVTPVFAQCPTLSAACGTTVPPLDLPLGVSLGGDQGPRAIELPPDLAHHPLEAADGGNLAAVQQLGMGNALMLQQDPGGNDVSALQQGDGNNALLRQEGSGNQLDFGQIGSNLAVELTQHGNQRVTVTQVGAGSGAPVIVTQY